jgi:hypothetical protein
MVDALLSLRAQVQRIEPVRGGVRLFEIVHQHEVRGLGTIDQPQIGRRGISDPYAEVGSGYTGGGGRQRKSNDEERRFLRTIHAGRADKG